MKTTIAVTASQQRPVSRMALTNRVSAAGVASVGAGVGVAIDDSRSISKLEIDERSAFSREDAEVNDHEHRQGHTRRICLNNLLEARLEYELVDPDQRSQDQHKRGDLRRMPK